MALIYFYDATDIDRVQLSQGLAETDHHWEYNDDPIAIDNLDPATEVVSVFVTSKITSDIIDKLPKLRLIACRSTGFNNVDMQAAERRGITVVNVPTYGEETVAEYTFTLLLALTRKLPQAIESFHDNTRAESLTGWDLSGKTIGVIGTGHIGRSVIRIARGFGMRVLAYDPYPDQDAADLHEYSYVSLQDLLQQSDVVTLHAPYTTENHHLLDANNLAHMKPDAVLINTARGELVDTKALIERLSKELLAGAGLDVIEGEQLLHLDEEIALLRSDTVQPDMLQYSVELLALQKLPNVIITPHNAFNTTGAISRINATTADNIIRYWYSDTPNVVKPVPKPIGKLTIIRHTESEWNATGQWSGITDVHLSERGFYDAGVMGRRIKDSNIHFDKAYCSEQIRTLETMSGVLDASDQFEIPYERSSAINERDYGKYTGKNKWEMRELIGEEEFQKLRRGWDVPVPDGETLRMVYERVVPFYKDTILPDLVAGNNILLVSHGNSIRALIKYIEGLSDTEIEDVEMITGTILQYTVDDQGKMKSKTQDTIEVARTNT